MEEMAKDPEFPKKWMMGMAMMLKKGLHIRQIHNLDRSFEEMMLGLESWIPMYMTGQISPYYLPKVQEVICSCIFSGSPGQRPYPARPLRGAMRQGGISSRRGTM